MKKTLALVGKCFYDEADDKTACPPPKKINVRAAKQYLDNATILFDAIHCQAQMGAFATLCHQGSTSKTHLLQVVNSDGIMVGQQATRRSEFDKMIVESLVETKLATETPESVTLNDALVIAILKNRALVARSCSDQFAYPTPKTATHGEFDYHGVVFVNSGERVGITRRLKNGNLDRKIHKTAVPWEFLIGRSAFGHMDIQKAAGSKNENGIGNPTAVQQLLEAKYNAYDRDNLASMAPSNLSRPNIL